jgi:hypothetical protein
MAAPRFLVGAYALGYEFPFLQDGPDGCCDNDTASIGVAIGALRKSVSKVASQ